MIMQDMKNNTYRQSSGPNRATVIGAVIGALTMLVGYNNVYKLKEGETGEFMRNGKTVATTDKPGIKITRPFTGTEFVKWVSEAKGGVESGTTLDGKGYVLTANASYKVPSTYGMEEYTVLNHLFTTSIGLAFNEVVGKKMEKDMTGKQLAVVAQEACDYIAKEIPMTKEGSSRKKPQSISCTLENAEGTKTATVYAKK